MEGWEKAFWNAKNEIRNIKVVRMCSFMVLIVKSKNRKKAMGLVVGGIFMSAKC
jgi:hypothetical protein